TSICASCGTIWRSRAISSSRRRRSRRKCGTCSARTEALLGFGALGFGAALRLRRGRRRLDGAPQQLGEVLARDRLAEVEALHLVALVLAQEAVLLERLYAFGDHG